MTDDEDDLVIVPPKKLAKTFFCKVPKIHPVTNKAMVDKDGDPILEEEHGEFTCYLHAHRCKLNDKSKSENKELMQDISKKHRVSIGS